MWKVLWKAFLPPAHPEALSNILWSKMKEWAVEM